MKKDQSAPFERKDSLTMRNRASSKYSVALHGCPDGDNLLPDKPRWRMHRKSDSTQSAMEALKWFDNYNTVTVWHLFDDTPTCRYDSLQTSAQTPFFSSHRRHSKAEYSWLPHLYHSETQSHYARA